MSNLIAPRLMEMKKEAYKNKDEVAKRTITALAAAFKQIQVDERKESLSEIEELGVVTKLVKQRKDSMEQFKEAGRDDLVEKEKAEIEYLESKFLPKQKTEEEVKEEIEKVVSTLDEVNPSKIGQVMGRMQHLKGSADMGLVSKLVKERLNK